MVLVDYAEYGLLLFYFKLVNSIEKKVLILTYYWPPAGGPGVQRWLKMSRYLAQKDTEVTILTVDPKKATYPLRDETLLDEIDTKLKVFYTDTFEPFSLYQKATGRKEVPYSGFANESDKPGPRQRISKFVRGNFFIPDARRGWNKYAFRRAENLIKQYNIDCIITTGPPHSTHLIGKKLKSKLGVKWLADFRDPWTDIYYYNELSPTAIARKLDLNYEKSVLTGADHILVVSEDMKRLYGKKLGSDKRIEIIHNGYDENDFNGLAAHTVDDKFELLYTGTLTRKYPLEGLLRAIDHLPDEQKQGIRLRFIGKRDEQSEKLLLDFNGCEVKLEGYIPHDKIVVEMISASALLLIIPDMEENKGILTGKIFEYLRSFNPILCLGPKEGDAAIMLSNAQAGQTHDYHDESIGDTLSKWISGQLLVVPDHDVVSSFSRERLSEKVADLI